MCGIDGGEWEGTTPQKRGPYCFCVRVGAYPGSPGRYVLLGGYPIKRVQLTTQEIAARKKEILMLLQLLPLLLLLLRGARWYVLSGVLLTRM